MKQANVVHLITAAGLVIQAAIIPYHEIAQGPLMSIHVPRRRLVSEERVEQRLRLGVVHALYADGKSRRDVKPLPARYRMGADNRMEHVLGGLALVIFLTAFPGHRDPWIAQLAALMDTHAPFDALLDLIGQAFIGAMHVGEFGIAALLRKLMGVEHGRERGLFSVGLV